MNANKFMLLKSLTGSKQKFKFNKNGNRKKKKIPS